MPSYSYRAIDENSTILTGKLFAKNEAELEGKLNTMGLMLIEAKKSGVFDFSRQKGPKLSEQDLLNFSFFLHLIITSGIPLMSGLMDMIQNKENKRTSQVAGLLSQKIESGLSLSAAMQDCPNIFPFYYVQMVKAGESSGSLDSILNDLMNYLEWQINFKKTTRAAIVYPSIVLGAVALLVVLLFTFVFPRLLHILVGLNVELPIQTRIIVGMANFFNKYFFYIIAGVAALFILLRIWSNTDTGRRRFDGLVLKSPLIGELVRKINLSRYFKALATLYIAGINMQQTFTIASGVVRNAVMHDALSLVTGSVMGGEGIATAMQKSGIFPSLIVDMISIGEKTGNLDTVALRASSIFDREVPEVLKKIMTYIEPLIILILGGIVLFVLLSVFLPIYKIVGGIRVR
jgi:type II secretory pathway component PulF